MAKLIHSLTHERNQRGRNREKSLKIMAKALPCGTRSDIEGCRQLNPPTTRHSSPSDSKALKENPSDFTFCHYARELISVFIVFVSHGTMCRRSLQTLERFSYDFHSLSLIISICFLFLKTSNY